MKYLRNISIVMLVMSAITSTIYILTQNIATLNSFYPYALFGCLILVLTVCIHVLYKTRKRQWLEQTVWMSDKLRRYFREFPLAIMLLAVAAIGGTFLPRVPDSPFHPSAPDAILVVLFAMMLTCIRMLYELRKFKQRKALEQPGSDTVTEEDSHNIDDMHE